VPSISTEVNLAKKYIKIMQENLFHRYSVSSLRRRQ
jgi:hypothetical protein